MNTRLLKYSSLVALLSIALAGCGASNMGPTINAASASSTITAQSKGHLATRVEWYSSSNDTEVLALGVGAKTLLGNYITDQAGGTPIRINDKEVARGSFYPTTTGDVYYWDSSSSPAKYYLMGKMSARNLLTLKFGSSIDVDWAVKLNFHAEAKGLNPMTRTSYFWLILDKMPTATTVKPETISRPRQL